MDPDVANFAAVSVIIVFLAGSLATILVMFTRAFRKPKQSALPDARQFDQRLDQLQQSVDAVAVEVERIAEAQRFSAKLLAERGEPSKLSRSGST
jgi:hypothetical protein